MAIEDRVSVGIDWTGWSEFKRYGTHILRELGLGVTAITWVTFWGLVVKLHLQQGDFISAAVVGVLFVLPAFVGYAWYLRGNLPNT
jgi:hypothetical protein